MSREIKTPSAIGSGSAVNDLLAAGFEALDLLNIGLVVCNALAEVLVTNQTAEQILSTRDGLELNSVGILTAMQDGVDPLTQMLRQVAKSRGDSDANRDCALAVRRPSGKKPLTLFVRAVNSQAGTRVPDEAAVLVLILDAALPVDNTAELRQLYKLTSTEAQLANLLMEGFSLEECCERMNIRRTTARMHLRNIFAKTGVRRQGELVSLLLKSIGLGPRRK